MKLNKKRWLTLHRRLALIIAIPVILWAFSGILHPIMANFMRPEIANRWLPPVPLQVDQNLKAPAEALKSLGEIHQLKLLELHQKPYYLAITPDQNQHYFDALTGEPSPSVENQYAEKLARAYLDDNTSKLVSVEKISEFGNTYGYINRLLPVFRVKLDRPDGVEVLVDNRTRRLASVDAPSGRLCTTLFDWFHRWSFLGGQFSPLRITVVSIFSFLAIVTGILGVINLFAFRGKSKSGQKRNMTTARKWHRRFGVFALLFYFMFGISAFYHVVYKFTGDDSPTWTSSQSVATSSLTTPLHQAITGIQAPVSELSLAVVNATPLYRFAVAKRGSKPAYIDASTGEKSSVSDTSFATTLALEFSGYSADDIDEIEPIFKFRNDYGFIFKRLPVWRVKFKDQEYWHYTVDTADAHMAMRMKPASLVETLSFINLHKLHFLDGLGKSTRDWVSVIAASSIALISIFGLLIVVRKRKSSSL